MENPFDQGYFGEDDLRGFGFRRVGRNVRIAKNTTIIGLENIEFGNNVRIDGYTTIIASRPGFVRVGSFVHIAGYVLLSGGAGITLEDFVGVSHGSRIYSRTDDYGGYYLTGPTVPEKYTGITQGPVNLKRHAIIGSGSVILPGIVVEEGVAVGALSLVTKSLDGWGVYAGCPAKRIKDRSKRLLELEAHLKKAEP